MPGTRIQGAAWACSLEDYAYTRSLDRPGWAWEFLRRNAGFEREYADHRRGSRDDVFIANGIYCAWLNRSAVAAQAWGLLAFECPRFLPEEATVFWHPNALKRIVPCTAAIASESMDAAFDLERLSGRRQLLLTEGSEYLVVQGPRSSARLAATGRSLLSGPNRLTFHIEGFERVKSVCETLQTLERFMDGPDRPESELGQTELRLRECLVALDGHLERKSYRQIAEVLYGEDRVSGAWTSETRFMKDKVRRAVERGVELMNGGYRKLLA